MLNLLNGYKGALEINGTAFGGINEAIQGLKGFDGKLTIIINKTGTGAKNTPTNEGRRTVTDIQGSPIYRIKVRQYMIKPSCPEFDFHDKWNNGNPMPLRIMVGRKLKETKGMVQMELWGEITQEISKYCMKCGKPLTNEVSKFFGIGPECGGHNYVNPFETKEQLHAAVEEMQQRLKEIKWTGWIIKSAIEEETYLEDREV